MKNIFLLILLLSSFKLFSQEKGGIYSDDNSKVEDKVTYKVVAKFPVNIVHGYTLDIESEVVRNYSDESKYSYKRNLIYDMTLKSVDFPKEGKQFIYVMVDSMKYKFSDSRNNNYDYNSMDTEDVAPLKFPDFENLAIPLGLEWEMVYSPYHDVVDITGEKIEYKRNYVNDKKLGIKDSIKLFRWNEGLSDDRLTFLANVHKGLIPETRVEKDSIWADFVFFELEGIKFRDSVSAYFAEYTVENYMIKAKGQQLAPAISQVLLTGIDKEFSEIIGAEGTCDYELLINPYGTTNEFIALFDVIVTGKIGNELFTQEIKTKMTWTLNGMWKW